MKVGEAFVEVRADTSKFGPELSKGVESSGKQAASGLSQALTAGIAVAGFSKLIGAASSLQEAGNKVKETFGGASGEVEAFAETSAESLGISESAALSMAGGLGSMLIPLGIAQDQAAGMSTTMLSLASDMGSFNDQDPSEMLERLRSGLAGESEPLRQFGAFISEARVQQYAWAEGIAENGVALTEQQKVLARYGLILQDTSQQQGDFTRTATSAANAQRTAAATAEDSAASLGESFLPVYEQGVAAVTAFASAFQTLPAPLQTVGVLLAGYAAFRGPLTAMFSGVATAAQTMVGRFREGAGGIKGFGAALSASSIIGGIAVVGLGLITAAMAKQANQTKETEGRLKSLTAAFQEGGLAAAGDTFLSSITEEAPDILNALRHMEGGVGGFVAAMGEGGDTAADAMRRLGAAVADVPLESWDTFMEGGFVPPEQQARIYDTVHQLNLFAEPLRDAGGAAQELTADQENVAAATQTAAQAFDEEISALDEVAASADAAHDALDALFGIQRSVQEGAIAVRDAARDLYQQFLELGRGGFRPGSEAADAFTSSMQASLTAISDQTIAMRNNGASIQEVRRFQRGAVDDNVALARAVGMPEGAIRRLVAAFGTVPERVLTDVEQRGAEEVQRRARDTREAVNQIPKSHDTAIRGTNTQALAAINEAKRAAEAWARMTYTAQLQASLGGSIPGAAHGRRAAGGPVTAGRAYLVGEAGPELMVPGESGTIIPNGGGGSLAGVGGSEVHIHIVGAYGDPDAFAAAIAPAVGRELAAIDRGL